MNWLRKFPIPNSDVRQRPWYRWHVTTWLAIVVVGAAIVDAQLTERFFGTFGTDLLTSHSVFEHGWPVNCVTRFVTTTNAVPSTVVGVRWFWELVGVLVNALVAVLLIGATALVCERWRRTSVGVWQLSLRSLFGITALVALGLVVWRNDLRIAAWLSTAVGRTVFIFPAVDHFDATTRWYLAVPISVAMCCVAISLGWLALALVRVIRNSVGQRRASER